MPIQQINNPLTIKVEDNSLWVRINNDWVRLDHIYTEATQSNAGLLSTEDKTKLDSLSNYTLPTTSDSTLGGIKTGFTQTNTERAVKVNSEGRAYVEIPETELPTTIPFSFSYDPDKVEFELSEDWQSPITIKQFTELYPISKIKKFKFKEGYTLDVVYFLGKCKGSEEWATIINGYAYILNSGDDFPVKIPEYKEIIGSSYTHSQWNVVPTPMYTEYKVEIKSKPDTYVIGYFPYFDLSDKFKYYPTKITENSELKGNNSYNDKGDEVSYTYDSNVWTRDRIIAKGDNVKLLEAENTSSGTEYTSEITKCLLFEVDKGYCKEIESLPFKYNTSVIDGFKSYNVLLVHSTPTEVPWNFICISKQDYDSYYSNLAEKDAIFDILVKTLFSRGYNYYYSEGYNNNVDIRVPLGEHGGTSQITVYHTSDYDTSSQSQSVSTSTVSNNYASLDYYIFGYNTLDTTITHKSLKYTDDEGEHHFDFDSDDESNGIGNITFTNLNLKTTKFKKITHSSGGSLEITFSEDFASSANIPI